MYTYVILPPGGLLRKAVDSLIGLNFILIATNTQI